MMQSLHVDLDERSYPIHIGAGLLDRADFMRSALRGRQVLVVSNTTVAPLYLARIRAAFDGLYYRELILPDGEQYKTLDQLSAIYDCLLQHRFNRSCTLVALGGGVIGDMVGFAAASYQRGVDFIQLPTTLLSQVDSSVGGKTGVNHPLGKNMIGAFHQPRLVLIDTDSLNTLPNREYSAGMAEVIKYGLISDAPFYEWLHSNMDALMARDAELLAQAIERSCRNKATVVASDEREGGVRAILNLGHTFGHAIETAQGYGSWLHGEAVAVGMLVAAKLSAIRGWITEAEVVRLRELLLRANLPVNTPDMSGDQFLSLMAVDKKVIDGSLRLVLLRHIGQAVISDDCAECDIRAALRYVATA